MPKVKKGINTFQVYQERKQERRENIIGEYLFSLEKTRVSFKYVTDLAEHVAVHIARLESKECNRATLLRNKRYKSLLLSYMAIQMSRGAQRLSSSGDIDFATRARLTITELEAENIRRENERLKAYVTELETRQTNAEKNCLPFPLDPAIDKNIVESLDDVKFRYIQTCQALRLVAEHWKEFIIIDIDKSVIRDGSIKLKNKNVVVEKDIAKAYIDWFVKNR